MLESQLFVGFPHDCGLKTGCQCDVGRVDR
jgi:hypothetical protein